jgi:hypothetical protein
MNTASHSGGCQCGHVRYSVKAPLPAAYACHCGDCKKQSASAFSMSIPILFERLNIEGEVAVYETCAFSGKRKLACFCNGCGTRLWHCSAEDSAWVTLKVGTLDDAAGISPRGHLWVSKKQSWIAIPQGVPAFETQPADVHAWRTSLE